MPVHTGFLTPAELNFAEGVCRSEGITYLFDGGYEDAERRICVLFPQDDGDGRPVSQALCVLSLTVPKGGRPLTHRDYLGSLLGLGVERSVIGDILVRENGADVIILRDMAELFLSQLSSVGRSSVSAEMKELQELDTGSRQGDEYTDTVASLRLDSVAASAFRLARGKAQDAVRQGLVSVNGRQVLKPDMEVSEGDRISFRGRGKAVLSEVGGRSRKDRIVIKVTRL